MGLALFLKRGMPAWLSAWSLPQPVEASSLKPKPKAPLPDALQSELAVLLASVVLSIREV